MKALFLFFFFCSNILAQQAEYNLDLHINNGDRILYVDPLNFELKSVVQDFNFSFINNVANENRKYSPIPLLHIDLTDSATILYYKKGALCYVYEIKDKSFGKNNALQDVESKRPVYDPVSKRIFFPEGTCLESNIDFKGNKLKVTIDKFIQNQIFFFVFIPKPEPQII